MGSYVIDQNILIPFGKQSGISSVNKFGRVPDVDTATTPETVWDQGGLWVPPTQARVHDLASDNAADAAAGTGAISVTVYGLDTDYISQSEEVDLDGVTPVSTVNSYITIFRMIVTDTGSGATNAGTITATAQTDATVTAAILPGNAQTLMAVYTVPSGKIALITSYYTTINVNAAKPAGASANVALMVKDFHATKSTPWAVKHIMGAAVDGSSQGNHRFTPYLKVPSKASIQLRVFSVTDDNTDLSGGFDLIIMDEGMFPGGYKPAR